VSFEYPKDRTEEVTSLRILCAPCTEERRRKKLAASGGRLSASAPAQGNAHAAGANNAGGRSTEKPHRPSASQVDTVEPVRPSTSRPGLNSGAGAPATKSPVPGAKPAPPAAPAKPTAAPAPTAGKTAPAGKPAPTAAPADSKPATAEKSPARPRAGRGKADTGDPDLAKLRNEAKRAAALTRAKEAAAAGGPSAKPVLDKSTKIGLFSALGLAVIAGGALLFVSNRKAADKKAFEERTARVQAFIESMRALNLQDPVEAQMVKTRAQDNAALWQDSDLQTEINSMVARAEGFLESNREREEFLGRLSSGEMALGRADSMSVQELTDLNRNLSGMIAQAPAYGEEVNGRVKAARTKVSRSLLTSKINEAKAFATEHPEDAMQALRKYGDVEVDIHGQLKEAINGKDSDSKQLLESKYQDVVAEQDKLCAALFTDAYINGIAWRDLFAPDAKWNPSSPSPAIKGFEWKLADGKMHLKGPDAEAKGQAIISIGDQEAWRDFVMEIDFKLIAGEPALWFRLPKVADTNVESFPLEAAEEPPGLMKGKLYHLTVSFIGSAFTVKAVEEEDIPTFTKQSAYYRSRRGAFGVTLPKGSEIEISKARVRLLRR